MKQLSLVNNTHLVNFPDNNTGMMQIKAFRNSHPEFKGRHIRHILQLLPSRINCGDIYEIK